MKKVIVFFTILCMVCSLTACGFGKKLTETQKKIAELNGTYYDTGNGRASLLLDISDSLSANVIVTWSNSPFNGVQWTMWGTYDPGTKTIVYENGEKKSQSFSDEEDEKPTEEVLYQDGYGNFTFQEDGSLLWLDQKENAGEGSVFTRGTSEDPQVSNPWIETTDLSEAMEVSGVMVPELEIMTAPMSLTLSSYRATPGTLEAVFTSKKHEMTIRISPTLSGDALSGVYQTYPKEWKDSVYGIDVECHGKGKETSLTYFDTEDWHFAVTCDPDNADSGLTHAQLEELFDSLSIDYDAGEAESTPWYYGYNYGYNYGFSTGY